MATKTQYKKLNKELIQKIRHELETIQSELPHDVVPRFYYDDYVIITKALGYYLTHMENINKRYSK